MTNGNNKEIFKVCSEGDELEKLEQLIAAGADIEARTEAGRTPLMVACLAGNFNFVRKLIKHGADVSAQDNKSFSVIHFAVEGSSGSIKLLAQAGADINAQTKQGYTPLMMACEIGKITAMENLCSLGANTALTTAKNAGPIVVALNSVKAWSASNAQKMVRILLAGGVSVGYQCTSTGSSEIHIAAQKIEDDRYRDKPRYAIFNAIAKAGDKPWRKNKLGAMAIDYLAETDLVHVKSGLKAYAKNAEQEVLSQITSLRGLQAYRLIYPKKPLDKILKSLTLTDVEREKLQAELDALG